MLNFDNYNIHSFIQKQLQYGNTIIIDYRYICNLMESQKIRKTKKNIQICIDTFINHIH